MRARRLAQETQRLTGERGPGNRAAVLFEELEIHPVIQRLLGVTDATVKRIDDINVVVDDPDGVAAAIATANSAVAVATQALADARAAIARASLFRDTNFIRELDLEDWQNIGTGANPTFITGNPLGAGRTLRFVAASGSTAGVAMQSQDDGWQGPAYVSRLEVEVVLRVVTGTLSAMQMHVDWTDDADATIFDRQAFADMVVDGELGSIQTYRATFEAPSVQANPNRMQVSFRSNFGTGQENRTVDIFRMSARPLSVEEGLVSANVTEWNQAYAEVDPNGTGFAAAFAGVMAETSAGQVSGFRATSWSDPDGQGGSVLELLGDVIAEGTLSANRLTVGLQQNGFINPEFTSPLLPAWDEEAAVGGAGAATVLRINAAGNNYAWPSFPTLDIYQSNGSTSGAFTAACRPPTAANGTLAPGWAVTPGERVSFSCHVAQLRCVGAIAIDWYGGSGNFITRTGKGNGGAGVFDTWRVGGSTTNPALWDRLWMLANAPSQAAYYRPIFIKGPTTSGNANSSLFIAWPMHARVHDAATSPSPYSPPGSTYIHGGTILTGSVTADRLIVDNLQALGLTVGTADIEDAAITAAKIGNATITSAKIADTIQSTNFVAGSAGWRIQKSGVIEGTGIQILGANIAEGAVTEVLNSTSVNITLTNTESTILTVVVAENNRPLTIFFEATVTGSNNALGVGGGTFFWKIQKGGLDFTETASRLFAENEEALVNFSTGSFGSGTFTLRAWKSGFGVQLVPRLVVHYPKK